MVSMALTTLSVMWLSACTQHMCAYSKASAKALSLPVMMQVSVDRWLVS